MQPERVVLARNSNLQSISTVSISGPPSEWANLSIAVPPTLLILDLISVEKDTNVESRLYRIVARSDSGSRESPLISLKWNDQELPFLTVPVMIQ